jgi:hypothetical protein
MATRYPCVEQGTCHAISLENSRVSSMTRGKPYPPEGTLKPGAYLAIACRLSAISFQQSVLAERRELTAEAIHVDSSEWRD